MNKSEFSATISSLEGTVHFALGAMGTMGTMGSMQSSLQSYFMLIMENDSFFTYVCNSYHIFNESVHTEKFNGQNCNLVLI